MTKYILVGIAIIFVGIVIWQSTITEPIEETPVGNFEPVIVTYKTIDANDVIDAVNKERKSVGLPTLARSTQLTKAACLKAQDMIDKNYWSHDSPDGRKPWDFVLSTGYRYQTMGENLGYGKFADASSVVESWMDSAGHRENILKTTYTETGMCVINADNYLDDGRHRVIVNMLASPY